jgi:hypothetical protein
MKQPRTSDFDPKADEQPLKSSMDNFPLIQRPPHTPNQSPPARTPVPPVPLVRDVPPTPRRKIKQRHPFDIYEDQLETLKKLSLEERMQGGIGSMSAMVREALDNYIARRQDI